MKAGCDLARSGRFQVVITGPAVGDGSWEQLADIDSHNYPGFVVILLADGFERENPERLQDQGAFEILDTIHDLSRVGEIARRALWAAYLKGAEFRTEALTAQEAS
jgi:hypothetical protein